MAKKKFKTEVNDLLNLMIHSLYSNKEIFLRELVSNASDALDKLNYLCLTDEAYKALSYTPRIEISLDSKNKILKISDNGIGMNEGELETNLGTIARSGTKGFMANLSGDAAKDSNLIGQFGVGFYSAFMVADSIDVISRKALEDEAFIWSSNAENYTISACEKDSFGTDIILHLKDDEFANLARLEGIIKKYSNHIPYPIFGQKEEYIPGENGAQGHSETKVVQLNSASALWQLPKSSLKQSDYDDFYKQISHDSADPLFHIHTKAEGVHEYTTLFYVPSNEPFDLYRVDYQSGVKLYVKRVFITDDAKELLPVYLRFVRGVIDVEDLPLNVSREILQENRILAHVKEQSVKKILGELAKMLKNDREKYEKFYALFGKVLKEGLYGFGPDKAEISHLALFKSNLREGLISLDEYKARMSEQNAEQKEIYFITGKDAKMLKNSPLLEDFNARGVEVLLCDDEIDAVVMPGLFEFDGTAIKSVTSVKSAEQNEEQSAWALEVAAKFKECLEGLVKDVKISTRLTNSLSCLVFDESDPDYATQQILRQMGQTNLPEFKPILEINAKHEIIKKLENNKTMIASVARLAFDLAKLGETQGVDDPGAFIVNINELVAKAL
ncbi:molecular chaperone HtpG [Campylobacter sp. JMF_01 NE2]|uniref:molecular chaperone HtpG n=1 Tax=unclassified Campylobacter TaxID=2593542 RepID=UPI0022E998D3|nr:MULTISPECIES: molecular chaperone HtpG [unclassified Campylobacter]MDA3052484.1 molecular chaperone HtpG [Campylobacter sp. JMF_03 NE3]MDA3066817.1 molecular chaperone HtpG [Campylobacter sp. JMF_01 NE2]